MKRVLVGDDHMLIRKGLRYTIEYFVKDTIVVEAQSLAEIMKLLHKQEFTHLLLDVVLGDGIILSILPNIKSLFPHIRVAIFTVQPKEVYFPIMKQFGVEYYIQKTATEEEGLELFQGFFNNESPPDQALYFVNPDNPFTKFTMQELQVLHYALKWYNTNEIADILIITSRRVRQIKEGILSKVGAPDFSKLQSLAAVYNVS